MDRHADISRPSSERARAAAPANRFDAHEAHPRGEPDASERSAGSAAENASMLSTNAQSKADKASLMRPTSAEGGCRVSRNARRASAASLDVARSTATDASVDSEAPAVEANSRPCCKSRSASFAPHAAAGARSRSSRPMETPQRSATAAALASATGSPPLLALRRSPLADCLRFTAQFPCMTSSIRGI